MNMLTLGSFLNHKETINIEFKEFCLKESIYNLLTKQQLQSLIYDSCFPKKFNDLIIYNIYKYLDIYLAKYASSFHNSESNKTKMSFIIGVDDDSEITGIPFKGNLINQHLQALQSYCEYLIANDLGTSCCLSVQLHIDECQIDTDLLDDEFIKEQLKIQHAQQNHYKIVYRKFNKKRKQWNKAIMKYKGKLQNVFDDLEFQEEFKEYLKEMKLLEKFEHEISSTYRVDLNKVTIYKYDKNTFMYWLIRFKDLKVKELLMIKPKAPLFPKLLNAEFCAITQLSNLRYRWIVNNPSLRYYALRIEIKRNRHCKHKVSFIDPRRRNWRKVKRYVEDYDPRSKDIN